MVVVKHQSARIYDEMVSCLVPEKSYLCQIRTGLALNKKYMDIRDIFKIPLFRNFTLKMQEELLDNIEYTVDRYPKGETIIRQGSSSNALHILLKGKLNVDVTDVSGNVVRVEVIQAPRTFATPHIFA